MNQLKHLFACALTLSLLTACGGSGGGSNVTTYSGSTSQATINSTNTPTFTKASADATANDLNSSNIPGAFKSSNKMMAVQSKTSSMLQQATVSGICDTGSVDVSGNQSGGSIQYSNCSITDITGTIIVNGTATYSSSNNFVDFSLTYTNFAITYTTVNGTVSDTIENMSISCTNNGMSCTISSDFTGSDGKIYRVANFEVTGSNPYMITGRIYHPNHGYVEISGTVTTSTCGNIDRPTSGSMTITGANGTASITFNDCNSFSVDINSSVTTANW